jgi:hypothetical protein
MSDIEYDDDHDESDEEYNDSSFPDINPQKPYYSHCMSNIIKSKFDWWMTVYQIQLDGMYNILMTKLSKYKGICDVYTNRLDFYIYIFNHSSRDIHSDLIPPPLDSITTTEIKHNQYKPYSTVESLTISSFVNIQNYLDKVRLPIGEYITSLSLSILVGKIFNHYSDNEVYIQENPYTRNLL